ncbi:copper resistance protein CopC [Herbaspirillum sp. RV1423]|uniref:copper resistance CopC family protein n=1 Tax=Herbaspirillum sp. RV1423 TaxID=1443993 RepID=UPI0009DDBAEC|nr:copper resistance protein CopC [Herbaspirillum sp. RV1423]
MFNKRILSALTLALISSALFVPGSASAHATLKSSTPANGAVLTDAPKVFHLEFGHAAKLTKFKLNKESEEIAVPVDPAAAASTTFNVSLPPLTAGKYHAKWSTLGDDGHAMTGSASFTVSGK